MIFFSRPCDHDRLNAAVYSVVSMHFHGAVHISGKWDAYETLEYLERRMRNRLIGTLNDEGTLFRVRGKYVYFDSDHVLITTRLRDIQSIGSISPPCF
jgi:hypothetical protein